MLLNMATISQDKKTEEIGPMQARLAKQISIRCADVQSNKILLISFMCRVLRPVSPLDIPWDRRLASSHHEDNALCLGLIRIWSDHNVSLPKVTETYQQQYNYDNYND